MRDRVPEADGIACPAHLATEDWLSPLRHGRRVLVDHFVLSLNAGTLALATIANGVIGFVYWWVAARAFTPTNVGLAAADISMIGLLSLAADVGLGTLLQGEIPRRKQLAPHLVSAALLASLATASALGLAYLAVAEVIAPRVGLTGGIPSTRLLLVVGVAVQTASLVLDAALIGMLSARLRLFRNLLFAGLKLLLVAAAVAIAIPEDWQLDSIIASWVIGQGLATLCLAGVVRMKGARIWYRPRFDALGRLVGVAFWHYVVNVAATAPTLVLPIVIAVLVSPEQNAAFYAAWMLLTLAGVVPAALANVLFTVGESDPSRAEASIRFSLIVSLGVGAIAAVGFWLLSNVALNMLNPVYSDLVGSGLRFLGVGVPLLAVKQHYITVQRLERRVRVAAFALGGLGAIEILFAALGAEVDGLFGAMTGWLLAMGFEAACLWPTVRRRLSRDGGGGVALTPQTGGGLGRGRDATERPTALYAMAGVGPPDSASAGRGATAICEANIVQCGDNKQERDLR
jgi:O-antigen/teichoic acid export membrane protein